MTQLKAIGRQWKVFMAFTLVFALSLQSATNVYAATSYEVHNVPPMYLNDGITAAQTTGIKLTPPTRNGESQTFPTQSGGILEVANLRYTELIYYTGATVNQSTKEVTLLGVTRGYCWDSNVFSSCESGRQWSRGTKVILNNDMRLYNYSLKKDLINTFTGSGAIKCTVTSQPCYFAPAVTTTQRNNFTYGTSSGLYPDIFNTTTGVRQYWNGSQWVDFGSGTIINASFTAAGKVQLAGTGATTAATATGSTGAYNVLTALYTTLTGGTGKYGFLPILNTSGRLNVQVGGTGSGSLTGSGLIYGQGTNPVRSLKGTSSGQFVRWNGDEWVAGTYTGLNKKLTITSKSCGAVTASAATLSTFTTSHDEIGFDPGVEEYAVCNFIVPDDYTASSTVTVQFIWSTDTVAGAGNVLWGAQGTAFGDGDNDASYGTRQTVLDARQNASNHTFHTSAATPAITIAGTPSAGEFVTFRISRVAADVSDTLGPHARLIGIIIAYS